MTVRINDISFDRVSYDRDADVLYLHAGDPATAVDFDGTPEGHHIRFDQDGKLVGITIVGAKRELEREGKITITIPDRVEVGPEALDEVLAVA
ncbi:MAG: DUF2283 domain-containing protein [Solirubrobacteraceae bacterium]